MRRIAALICLAIVCCAAPAAFAQFTLVYNLPPDEIPDPFFNRQIRTPDTQVNVYSTGFIGQDLKIGGTGDDDQPITNIEVNVLGGFVDSGRNFMLGLSNLGRAVFGSANDRRLKRYQPLVAEINSLESDKARSGRSTPETRVAEHGSTTR